jgi:formylglycine-generating enzyme required for sulfatase activity
MVPAGTFLLGSPEDEPGRLCVEGPQQRIAIERPFGVGKLAITVDQYTAFVADSGYDAGATCRQWDGASWRDQPGSFLSPGFTQGGDHPAVCVSWEDATAYAAWLAARTGRRFRLLTEAEWEYGARAGTTTPYWWGASVSPGQANGKLTAAGQAGTDNGSCLQHTLPATSFAPNPWGLYQMHGNTWEWVEDCWHPSHAGASPDGRARQGPADSKRVVRGGAWHNGPPGLRSARRHAADRHLRRSDIGFRVAEDIEPTRRSATDRSLQNGSRG